MGNDIRVLCCSFVLIFYFYQLATTHRCWQMWRHVLWIFIWAATQKHTEGGAIGDFFSAYARTSEKVSITTSLGSLLGYPISSSALRFVYFWLLLLVQASVYKVNRQRLDKYKRYVQHLTGCLTDFQGGATGGRTPSYTQEMKVSEMLVMVNFSEALFNLRTER